MRFNTCWGDDMAIVGRASRVRHFCVQLDTPALLRLGFCWHFRTDTSRCLDVLLEGRRQGNAGARAMGGRLGCLSVLCLVLCYVYMCFYDVFRLHAHVPTFAWKVLVLPVCSRGTAIRQGPLLMVPYRFYLVGPLATCMQHSMCS